MEIWILEMKTIFRWSGKSSERLGYFVKVQNMREWAISRPVERMAERGIAHMQTL